MEGMAKTSDAARTLRRMEWNDFIRCSPKEVIDKWADEPRSNRAMRRARHGPQRRDRCDRVMPVDGCAFRLERRTPALPAETDADRAAGFAAPRNGSTYQHRAIAWNTVGVTHRQRTLPVIATDCRADAVVGAR